MNRLISWAVAALMCIIAWVITSCQAFPDTYKYDILVPPVQYQHGPFKYPVVFGKSVFKVAKRDWMSVAKQCMRPDYNINKIMGCTLIRDNTCWPFVLDTGNKKQMEVVIMHELAHCRGWDHD